MTDLSAAAAAMTEKPLVSVLMTAYNRERYIADAIRSVLSSTYENFELIIVDDGSTDGTLAIAEQFAEQDSRIRVYRNERNLGDYPNRNRAAALASGKYLKYVDSDDIIYPYGLEAMVEVMERFPEAALGMSDLAPRPDTPFPIQLTPEEAYQEHFLGRGLFGHGPLATIIRADAFRAVGGFSGLRLIGDTELWAKLAARFPVVLMPPGFTWWRQHADQEYAQGVATSDAYPRLLCRVYVEALASPHCPLSAEERKRALARVRCTWARTVLGLVRRGRLAAAARLFRERNVVGKHFVTPPKSPGAAAEGRTP